MKKIAPIFAIILIISLSVGGYMYFGNRPDVKKTTFFAFDTVINLTLSSKDAQTILDECEKEIYRLDGIFNVHSPESEIYMLNESGAESPVEVSEELYGVIERSIGYSADTEGAFDITIKPLVDLWDIKNKKTTPPEDFRIKETVKKVSYNNIVLYPESKIGFSHPSTKLDLGGVAKGYGADRLCEIIKAHSFEWALLDLGGNIYCMGDREFNIGIQHPDRERGEYFRTVKAKNKSVVTGGGYERGYEANGRYYHHIISPFDGYPADSGLKSVTVTGDSSEMCDAYSTAVFVYGKNLAKKLCEKEKNISFIIMDNNGNVEEIK